MHSERFIIGQYGGYNENKQQRDFRKGFYGVEMCLMKSEDDIKALKELSVTENFKLGIHFPLRANQWIARDPLYLSQNVNILNDSYAFMEKEFEYANQYGAEYILTHYPKPVIIKQDRKFLWKFERKEEYCFDTEYSFTEFELKSCRFFEWISAKGTAYGFAPVLEFDGVNKYITDTDLLDKLLAKYPNIKLCLDIGRIHLQDTTEPSFCGYEFVKRFAKYTELVHLWNAQV
jgi:sugar phosphate isomerase/epimerase